MIQPFDEVAERAKFESWSDANEVPIESVYVGLRWDTWLAAKREAHAEMELLWEPTPAVLLAYRQIHEWLTNTQEGQLYAVQAAFDGAAGEPYWRAMFAAAIQKEAG